MIPFRGQSGMQTVKRTKSALKQPFETDDFPRSAKYGPEWVIPNMMGPNVLWLAESLSQVMDLKGGTGPSRTEVGVHGLLSL